MTIQRTIQSFLAATAGEHDRARSWEHCYTFFRTNGQTGILANRDYAALHLAFMLVGAGMYRPSGFLFKRAYTVHLKVIDVLGEASYSPLWTQEFGSSPGQDNELVPLVLKLSSAVREAYLPDAATEMLVTKAIWGTIGCLPALDDNFREGFGKPVFRHRTIYPKIDCSFLEYISDFCHRNFSELRQAQDNIQAMRSIRYPLMKIVDMHFFQLGCRKKEEAPGDTGPV